MVSQQQGTLKRISDRKKGWVGGWLKLEHVGVLRVYLCTRGKRALLNDVSVLYVTDPQFMLLFSECIFSWFS